MEEKTIARRSRWKNQIIDTKLFVVRPGKGKETRRPIASQRKVSQNNTQARKQGKQATRLSRTARRKGRETKDAHAQKESNEQVLEMRELGESVR